MTLQIQLNHKNMRKMF